MSYLLVICFIILVVCVILQTIMMYSDFKIRNTLTDDNNVNKQLFVRLNNESNSYVSIDAIVELDIYSMNEKEYILEIQTECSRFVEKFDNEDEARLRLEELLTIIEESYE